MTSITNPLGHQWQYLRRLDVVDLEHWRFWIKLLKRDFGEPFDAGHVGRIGERKQLAIGREEIDALGIAVEAAIGLFEYFREEFTFFVLALPMNVLIDGDGHEFLAQDFDESRILKNRRTVGDAVVSDTRERMAGAAEHINGLVLLRGLCAGFEDGEMPGYSLPGFLGGGEVLVEFG